jgi:hypothetical protein
MKKNTFILLFILIISGFSACKKHETTIPAEPEYIIGEWKLDKIVVLGMEQDITDCHKQSYMIFESNHDAENKYYTIYQSTGNCELHLHYRGTWSYRNDKFYFNVTQSSTSQNPNYEKELHFLDTEHFYVLETYQGVQGKFYFEKQD